MDHHGQRFATDSPMNMVIEFLEKSSGLVFKRLGERGIQICQKVDGKQIYLDEENIISVIPRRDYKNDPFIQINFVGGKKILLTDQLIGFKPADVGGLPLDSLPKVVATPDLLSLFEALEDCMSTTGLNIDVLLELRQALMAIIEGAESVGIDLTKERLWLKRIGMKQKTPHVC